MKSKFFWVLAIPSAIFLASCSDVRLNIKPNRIYFHSQGCELAGGSPAGGSYSGEGVLNGVFYPEKTRVKGKSYDVDITYSFLFRTAKAKIRVFGAEDVDVERCPKCKGTRQIPCPSCGGDPKSIKYTPCSKCSGSGKEKCQNCKRGKTGIWPFNSKCSECDGASSVKCKQCDGKKLFPCCPDGRGWLECDGCSLKK